MRGHSTLLHTVLGLLALFATAGSENAFSQVRLPPEPRQIAAPTRPTETIAAPAASPSTPATDAAKPIAAAGRVDEVREYLWGVYQRTPIKTDGHGDFTWKDISAAEHSGRSLEDYVIGGIDPDYREVLFAAGHAMDAAGVEWTILSGFRDDFRQGLASGLKARVNNSFHGGSAATGGYGHGCAVDLASVDRLSDDKVWRWVDRNGREFALVRPLRAADPAHTLPMPGWHELGAMLRNKRLGVSIESELALASSLVGVEQYLCIRPLPLPEKPVPAGGDIAEAGHHPTTASWSANHAAHHDTTASRGTAAAQKPVGAHETPAKPSIRTVAHETPAKPPIRTVAAPTDLRPRRPDAVSDCGRATGAQAHASQAGSKACDDGRSRSAKPAPSSPSL